MRVITGISKGARLKTPQGRERRPTADRVKEAVFSIIQFEIEGRRVLDLFAGSGQMGIEALSRGAAEAVFVDKSPAAQKIIKENLIHTKLLDKSRAVAEDFASFLRQTEDVFDIVFIDPPYGQSLVAAALELSAEHVSRHGVIICEAAKKAPLPQEAGGFELKAKYFYGKTAVGVYRFKDV
jgi:16S rRNA (guanine966-N2)-methyltransferase